MPLKLVPPDRDKGESSYYIRGTYLGVRIRQSAKTDRKPLADKELKRVERAIEEGRFTRQPATVDDDKSFAAAAEGYLKVCPDSEVARVERLLAHFKDMPLADFDLNAVDAGEEHFYPGRLQAFEASTLNREYRTPLAAVLHDAAEHGRMHWLRIPKYKEKKTTRWLEPERAMDLIAAAAELDAAADANKRKKLKDARLAPLLITLFTTAFRISEACKLTWADVSMERREFGPLRTKNGDEYVVHMGDLAFEAIANLPGFDNHGRRIPGRRLFGFRDRHAVKYMLAKACEKVGLVKRDAKGEILRHSAGGGRRRNAQGLAKTTFNLHMARHSFATWVRRIAGQDLRKLMDLGRWKNVQSVARYAHVAADEHAGTIAQLPLKKKETA